MTFDDQVAIVTGAGGGLGRCHALELARRGARVLVNDLGSAVDGSGASTSAAQSVVDEITAAGGTAVANGDSVASEDGGAAIVAAAMDAFGKVDILVNNAGATWGAPAEDHPLEAWDKLVNVNLTGAFVLTQLIGKRSMIPAKWGRVINVASIAGLMGQDKRIVRTLAYNATKGGLVNFTRALAAEWGEYGITVNAICPGFFPSKMTRATLDTTGELIRDWTPTKRLGNDEDLKGLAVLLASEASRHLTGQAIAVDGGATVI
jgi:NAD(P)-dependent dehydrogenase (short-subunit alcohol dehydrogenase family)